MSGTWSSSGCIARWNLTPPSYGLPSTIHAGATRPSRFTPIGAPIALPMRPPDDDPVDLTVAPLHTFE
eukprot:1025016-Prymnesium_polylepis.1